MLNGGELPIAAVEPLKANAWEVSVVGATPGSVVGEGDVRTVHGAIAAVEGALPLTLHNKASLGSSGKSNREGDEGRRNLHGNWRKGSVFVESLELYAQVILA